MSTDFSGLRRQVELAKSKAPAIAQEGVMAIGEVAARAMFHASPTDTNRFARAWAIANNAAGLASMPVPGVKPSYYVSRNRERLALQVERVKRILKDVESRYNFITGRLGRWYDAVGRKPDKFYRSQKRLAEKLYNEKQRLLEVLEEARAEIAKLTPTAIIIGGRRIGKRGKFGLSNLATVRTTVYGGSGRLYFSGSTALIDLTNLEAHASIVASKSKIIPAAKLAVLQTGVARGRLSVRRAVGRGIPGGTI